MRSEQRILRNRLRRRQQLRHYFMLAAFSLVLVITLSVGCFGIWSRAKDKSDIPQYKYYTQVEVQYGDTLWDIASRYCSSPYSDYNDYISEVMQINFMLDTDITAGSVLIVPYYSSEFKE